MYIKILGLSDITFQYPVYWVFAVAVGAAVLAGLLYYNNRQQSSIRPNMRLPLAILRFIVLFIIGLLLLGPLLKDIQLDVQKPLIIVAVDQSASITTAHEEAALQTMINDLDQLKQKLAGDYEVKMLSFAEKVRDTLAAQFDGKATHLSAVFEEGYNRFGAENLAGVILSSDGIFNEGADPLYSLDKLKVPVFGILMGDTTQRKDIRIKKVFHNNIAYLGDRFNVQVDISAFNFAGQQTVLTVSEFTGQGYTKVKDIPIAVDKTDFFKTVEVELDAKTVGVRRFKFALPALPGELSTVNNAREIFIEVLDNRQKILMLSLAPHPDIAAIRQVMEKNRNYQVEHSLLKDFKGNIQSFDLVIFHQLPSKNADIRPLISQLNNKNIPRLFILGLLTDLNAFNSIQTAVSIRSNLSRPNEVQAQLNPAFNLFTTSDVFKQYIRQFIPLAAPFGEYTIGAGTDVLLYQRIGQVETQYPLVLLQSGTSGKTGIIAAEGFFKWRMYDYLQRENTDVADELIQKMVTYLNVKEDKRRFRSYPAKNIFDENESINLGAELYNASYELVNEPDVQVVIKNEKGDEFPFAFNKRGRAYFLDAGLLPVGQYQFTASVVYDKERLDHSGQFSIQPIEKELYELTADHGLLRRLATAYGGDVVALDAIATLEEKISNNKKIKSIIYENAKIKPAIDYKWLFFLLIVFLGVEWFARKYFGGY